MIIGVDYHPSFQTIAFLIEELVGGWGGSANSERSNWERLAPLPSPVLPGATYAPSFLQSILNSTARHKFLCPSAASRISVCPSTASNFRRCHPTLRALPLCPEPPSPARGRFPNVFSRCAPSLVLPRLPGSTPRCHNPNFEHISGSEDPSRIISHDSPSLLGVADNGNAR